MCLLHAWLRCHRWSPWPADQPVTRGLDEFAWLLRLLKMRRQTKVNHTIHWHDLNTLGPSNFGYCHKALFGQSWLARVMPAPGLLCFACLAIRSSLLSVGGTFHAACGNVALIGKHREIKKTQDQTYSIAFGA